MRAWPKLEVQRELAVGFSHLCDIQFSPTGKNLAVVGGSPGLVGNLQFFSWPSGQASKRIDHGDDVINSVARKTDGSGLALGTAEHAVILTDANGRLERRLTGHSRSVLAVAFLPDNQSVLSTGRDQSVRLWKADDGMLVRTLDNHTAEVFDMAVRPGSHSLSMIATAGADRTVRLWQPTIGRLVRFVRLESKPLAIDWTSDGAQILAACQDGHVRVVDPDTVEVLHDVPGIEGWAYCVAAAPNGHGAVIGGAGGQFQRVAW